jgi:hypothetical protein
MLFSNWKHGANPFSIHVFQPIIIFEINHFLVSLEQDAYPKVKLVFLVKLVNHYLGNHPRIYKR